MTQSAGQGTHTPAQQTGDASSVEAPALPERPAFFKNLVTKGTDPSKGTALEKVVALERFNVSTLRDALAAADSARKHAVLVGRKTAKHERVFSVAHQLYGRACQRLEVRLALVEEQSSRERASNEAIEAQFAAMPPILPPSQSVGSQIPATGQQVATLRAWFENASSSRTAGIQPDAVRTSGSQEAVRPDTNAASVVPHASILDNVHEYIATQRARYGEWMGSSGWFETLVGIAHLLPIPSRQVDAIRNTALSRSSMRPTRDGAIERLVHVVTESIRVNFGRVPTELQDVLDEALFADQHDVDEEDKQHPIPRSRM